MAISTTPLPEFGQSAAWKVLNERHAQEICDLYVQNFRDFLTARAAEAIEEACERLRQQIVVKVDSEYSHMYMDDMHRVAVTFKGKPDVGI